MELNKAKARQLIPGQVIFTDCCETKMEMKKAVK